MTDMANLIKQPLVSVALPVLNGGALLEISVRSVVNQSWFNWELFILDDGSNDGAIDRLPFLADPRIIVVRDGFNRGISSRLNQAIAMAKGKYFARMDHDDICHPERFAKQVAYLEDNSEVDLLSTKCVTINEMGKLNGTLPFNTHHTSICLRPWLGFYMSHPSWMGRTEWFRRHFYLDPGPYCCEDQELLLRAHLSSCYHTLPDSLLAYRIRGYTPWLKLLKTRVALLRIQVLYFFNRNEYKFMALSISVGLARIVRDTWRKFCRVSKLFSTDQNTVMASGKELVEWELLIKSLEASSKYVNNNDV